MFVHIKVNICSALLGPESDYRVDSFDRRDTKVCQAIETAIGHACQMVVASGLTGKLPAIVNVYQGADPDNAVATVRGSTRPILD